MKCALAHGPVKSATFAAGFCLRNGCVFSGSRRDSPAYDRTSGILEADSRSNKLDRVRVSSSTIETFAQTRMILKEALLGSVFSWDYGLPVLFLRLGFATGIDPSFSMG